MCESVQRGMSLTGLPARLVRADGGRQPRHPALAAAAAWDGRGHVSTPVEYVVVGLGRPGQRHRVGARPPRASRDRAGAVRARPRARRQPRHQPDPAAQLPHAGVRAAHAARRTTTGPGSSRLRRGAGDHGRRPRPVPARCAIRPADYTESLTRSASSYEVLDASDVTSTVAAVPAAGGHARRCTSADAAIVPAGRGTRRDAGAGPPPRRRPARAHAGDVGPRPRRRTGSR